MSRIPKPFIEELLTRVDIVDVIDARLPLKKSGANFVACCPFHGEKSPSFTVSPTKQFYHCFGCGVHDNAIGFLMAFDHVDFVEAIETLAADMGMPIPKVEGDKPTADHSNHYALMEKVVSFYQQQLLKHPQAAGAKAYLTKRTINDESLKRFKLGFAPAGWDTLQKQFGEKATKALVTLGLLIEKEGRCYDRFRNRILFPIYDKRNRPIGFGGRVMSPEEQPKYLNSPETPLFHKGRSLYGLYAARQAIRDEQTVLIVEGYMDVIALAQHGVGNAVATLGTATTADHLQQLFRIAPCIIFCFDGDKAGKQAAKRALQTCIPLLRDGLDVQFLFLPSGEDPDSIVSAQGQTGFLAALKQAQRFPDYFLQQFNDSIDISSMTGRAHLVEVLKPQLEQLQAPALRALLIDRLAGVVRMDKQALSQMLGNKNSSKTQVTQHSARALSTRSASLMRTAVALLLQRPGLAKLVTDGTAFEGLDLPGLDIFKDLLHLLKGRPEISTAVILAHWEEETSRAHLERLATWVIPLPEDGWEAEFQGIVTRLGALVYEQLIERLLAKANQQGLSDAERTELQTLIQERTQTTT